VRVCCVLRVCVLRACVRACLSAVVTVSFCLFTSRVQIRIDQERLPEGHRFSSSTIGDSWLKVLITTNNELSTHIIGTSTLWQPAQCFQGKAQNVPINIQMGQNPNSWTVFNSDIMTLRAIALLAIWSFSANSFAYCLPCVFPCSDRLGVMMNKTLWLDSGHRTTTVKQAQVKDISSIRIVQSCSVAVIRSAEIS